MVGKSQLLTKPFSPGELNKEPQFYPLEPAWSDEHPELRQNIENNSKLPIQPIVLMCF
jgi:hypothetical protein